MNCPVCNIALAMSERQGVEIDYCPQCRGVWLDRGELDKIIEMSVSKTPRSHPVENGHDRHRTHHDRDHDGHYGDDHSGGHYRKKRNFLLDLFD